jgi:hypothetical protein
MHLHAGQSAGVTNDDDDMLQQAESLDSDEVRNDDGDQVVDPPDEWIGAQDSGSLDDKLAAEVPNDRGGDPVSTDTDASRQREVALGLISDEDLDGIDPAAHGRHSGQIDGTPEDGHSFFDVAE